VDGNFRTFGDAFLTLIRFSTGEFWNGLMHEVRRAGPVASCLQTPWLANRDQLCSSKCRDPTGPARRRTRATRWSSSTTAATS
jgi:hypothetical protein